MRVSSEKVSGCDTISVNCCSSNPYLGVTLSVNMKWNSHISKVSKKANFTFGFLKRNLKHCPQDFRRTAYLSLVRSTLEYSSIVWDPYLQKDIDKLEKVQRHGQAARFIFKGTCSAGSIGYLRSLVIFNCVLAKTIAYFQIFLGHIFFCDYTFSYCMKPSGMCLHIYSLTSSAFLKYQTSRFYCT